jgi:hypothetical protein
MEGIKFDQEMNYIDMGNALPCGKEIYDISSIVAKNIG